jgi:hypothetical protein
VDEVSAVVSRALPCQHVDCLIEWLCRTGATGLARGVCSVRLH